nr:MAG TPA: hypothetical protein [Caudoviricetes sp.]
MAAGVSGERDPLNGPGRCRYARCPPPGTSIPAVAGPIRRLVQTERRGAGHQR